MAEFETDVSITEDFKTYSAVMKLDLIEAIINGDTYEFEGVDTVNIEIPE